MSTVKFGRPNKEFSKAQRRTKIVGELVIHHPLVHLYLMCFAALFIVHIYGFLHRAPEADDHSTTPTEVQRGDGLFESSAAESAVPSVSRTEIEAEMVADRTNVRSDFNQPEGV